MQHSLIDIRLSRHNYNYYNSWTIFTEQHRLLPNNINDR